MQMQFTASNSTGTCVRQTLPGGYQGGFDLSMHNDFPTVLAVSTVHTGVLPRGRKAFQCLPGGCARVFCLFSQLCRGSLPRILGRYQSFAGGVCQGFGGLISTLPGGFAGHIGSSHNFAGGVCRGFCLLKKACRGGLPGVLGIFSVRRGGTPGVLMVLDQKCQKPC